MFSLRGSAHAGFAAALIATAAVAAEPPQPAPISSIDLSRPFGTRSAWRFTATQGPSSADPFDDGAVPGEVMPCLAKAGTAGCDPSLRGTLGPAGGDLFSKPHFLGQARIVRPGGPSGRALLLVQLASLRSGDGDQRVLTQALAYDRRSDRFVRIYEIVTGRNNNQETRYIDAGALKGAIISAEPTRDAPFAFWITVNTLTRDFTYRQALRYRSATRYGDGNRLAVIDSEMPNIQRRLGRWRPGRPLPRPAHDCARPHLIGMELWCA